MHLEAGEIVARVKAMRSYSSSDWDVVARMFCNNCSCRFTSCRSRTSKATDLPCIRHAGLSPIGANRFWKSQKFILLNLSFTFFDLSDIVWFFVMADVERKKRKRQSQGDDLPNKKTATERLESGRIKVHFDSDNGPQPVLLSSPGLTAPRIAFKAYTKPASASSPDKTASVQSKHDLLLHSSEHPRLDYTASPATLDEGLSHYVAVFDPTAKQLQIVPAHHLSLRSILRSDAKDEAAKQRRTIGQQRAELGREFGTKKAKKAIADKTINAIVKGVPGKDKDEAQNAIFDSMAESALPTLSQQEQAEAIVASKPIPKPYLEAKNVEDVYTFDTLVPQDDARLLDVKDWQDTVRAGEGIVGFAHHYPLLRVTSLAKSDDILRLKALRYLTLLLEFHDALLSAGRAGKKVPKKETLKQKLSYWPETLVDRVRVRFADQKNELPKWHMDNLYTHICALSLYIDAWTTDTTDLKMDLKMENKEIAQYFRELGCKVAPPTEKERESVNQWFGGKPMNKGQAAVARIAKLKLSLDFPKARSGRKT